MKPLNQKEITIATLKFMGANLFAILLVAWGVYSVAFTSVDLAARCEVRFGHIKGVKAITDSLEKKVPVYASLKSDTELAALRLRSMREIEEGRQLTQPDVIYTRLWGGYAERFRLIDENRENVSTLRDSIAAILLKCELGKIIPGPGESQCKAELDQLKVKLSDIKNDLTTLSGDIKSLASQLETDDVKKALSDTKFERDVWEGLKDVKNKLERKADEVRQVYK